MSNRGGLDIQSGDWTTLGAVSDGDGVNFAIFSAHAERVELCLTKAGRTSRIASCLRSSQTRYGTAMCRV
jgi:pullulanase/glycogen debranching enzyme